MLAGSCWHGEPVLYALMGRIGKSGCGLGGRGGGHQLLEACGARIAEAELVLTVAFLDFLGEPCDGRVAGLLLVGTLIRGLFGAQAPLHRPGRSGELLAAVRV